MPYAEHDEDHEYQSTSFAACIRQNPQHWQGAGPDSLEVLDRE